MTFLKGISCCFSAVGLLKENPLGTFLHCFFNFFSCFPRQLRPPLLRVQQEAGHPRPTAKLGLHLRRRRERRRRRGQSSKPASLWRFQDSQHFMDSFYRDCARVLQDLVKVKRDETGDINPQSVGWAVCPRSGGHVMAPPTKECAGTTIPFLIPTDTHILAVGSHVRARQTIFKKGFLLNLRAFPCAK